MTISRDVAERITNSDKPGHRAKVSDDAKDIGGFLMLEWWGEPSGSGVSATFDSWAADEDALQALFSETDWQGGWQASIDHVRGDAGTLAISGEEYGQRLWQPVSVNELKAFVAG